MVVVVRTKDFEAWSQELNKQLKLHPGALESMRLLQAEGMSASGVIRFLHDYTDPASIMRGRKLRQAAGRMAKRLGKLEQLAKKIEAELSDLIPDLLISESRFESFHENATVAALQDIATAIEPLRVHYTRISNQKGKARNEELLIHLCLTVEATTGRSHWGDIAYLLEVAAFTHRRREDWDAESVRKIVDRYRTRYPKIYKSTRSFLFENAKTSRTSPDARRSTRNRRLKQTSHNPFIKYSLPNIGRQSH